MREDDPEDAASSDAQAIEEQRGAISVNSKFLQLRQIKGGLTQNSDVS